MTWSRALVATIVVFALGTSACAQDDGRDAQDHGWARTLYW